MKNLRPLTLAAAISAACATPAFADAPSSVAEALKAGDVTLSFRMRYEDVTLTNPSAEDGTADLLSLKTRLTYTSADYQGWGLGIEMDDVTHINDLEPEGPENGKPVIADPAGTEVNQYFLSYKFGKTATKYGRQRILLDNQRFVGGVGFRQNEQTYDAFSVTSKDVENLTLFAAYVTNVNRIFGEGSTPDVQSKGQLLGDHDHKTVLLNANYKFMPELSLTGYYYAIDNITYADHSSDTFGLRATGQVSDFGYVAEFASQSEGGDNPAEYSAAYMNLEGSYAIKPVKFTIGHEVLGSDEGKGYFKTPLATLHKFQGWTDSFLGFADGNKAGGIADTYITVAGKAGPVKLVGSYHTLSTDDSDVAGFDDYGTEIGFVIAGKVAGVGLSLKYAAFSADDDSGMKDTDKLWLTAETSF